MLSNIHKFRPFEVVKNIYLLDQAFNMLDGTLTPSNKLSRYGIQRKYSELLKSLFNPSFIPLAVQEKSAEISHKFYSVVQEVPLLCLKLKSGASACHR